MNPIILPPAMFKEIEQTGLFNLVMATVKENCEFTPLKLLCLYRAVDGRFYPDVQHQLVRVKEFTEERHF